MNEYTQIKIPKSPKKNFPKTQKKKFKENWKKNYLHRQNILSTSATSLKDFFASGFHTVEKPFEHEIKGWGPIFKKREQKVSQRDCIEHEKQNREKITRLEEGEINLAGQSQDISKSE